MPVKVMRLEGERFELALEDSLFPKALKSIPHPPARLYGVGRPGALAEGLAVVGARRATPYGRGCAKRFAAAAAERGVAIISGGARGCDAVAHEAALAAGAPTVAFLGGGCNQLYPAENAGLFQRIVAAGGAVVSEHEWDFPPQPHTFRARNRLIAGLSRVTLIVETNYRQSITIAHVPVYLVIPQYKPLSWGYSIPCYRNKESPLARNSRIRCVCCAADGIETST